MNRDENTWATLSQKERTYLEAAWRSFRKGNKRITLRDYHNLIGDVYLGYVNEGLKDV